MEATLPAIPMERETGRYVAKDIHDSRRERFWSGYRLSSRELVRSFLDDIQDLDSDVVLSTARKAACLLDTARLARLWTPTGLHVSDRALEFPVPWLEGKKVTVVDDVVGTGKTLDSVVRRCQERGAAELEVRYIALKSNWPSTAELLQERHPQVPFRASPLVDDGPELVHEIVSSISTLPRPYNIDWPLFAGWRLTLDELDWLVSDPDWSIRHVRSATAPTTPSFVTLEATPSLRRALSQATGIRVDMFALSKVRLYLESIAPDIYGVCVLGVCSLNRASGDDLERFRQRYQLPGVGAYGIARVAQYDLSVTLARHFMARGERHLSRGSMAESKWQRHLCFGPTITFAPQPINPNLVPIRAREATSPRLSADRSRFARNALIGAMQSASMTSPYRAARRTARLSKDNQRQFLRETPHREAFSFFDLVNVVLEQFEEASESSSRTPRYLACLMMLLTLALPSQDSRSMTLGVLRRYFGPERQFGSASESKGS